MPSVKKSATRKRVITAEEVFEKVPYSWSSKKKWILLTVVALCQTSMNFNASVYSNAIPDINKEFGTDQARLGMALFLVLYAFGCELWAPYSEELGRWPIMQGSLLCVNATILLGALAPNFNTVLASRALGGLSSAGGSVTLGMVADMFSSDEQQFAVLWASLFSCFGAVLGGICGGPIEQYLTWRWNFWIQLIFGLVTQAIHFFLAKETRSTVLLDKQAKVLRKEGVDIWGPNEVKTFKERWNWREIVKTMYRPYQMFLFEPIVLFLSLLSGFADALIFTFFECYAYIFHQWGFSPSQISLALIPLAGGYILAYLSFFPVIKRHNARRQRNEVVAPESRLWWLLYHVVLLPVGLLGCAFVATGPPLHWSGVIVFSTLIGMANFSIYYATIDYMVAAYGEYAASATGGNGFARDFLAGMCALYTGPMFHNLGIQKSNFLLFGLALAVCVPVYIFYFKGPEIRKRSKFASELAGEQETKKHEKENAVQESLRVRKQQDQA